MKNPNSQPILALRPEIQLAIRLASKLFELRGLDFVVTWTTGGTHMKGSLHPKRRAVDSLLPTKEEQGIVDELSEILGPDYDVVNESDHLHMEWDPK